MYRKIIELWFDNFRLFLNGWSGITALTLALASGGGFLLLHNNTTLVGLIGTALILAYGIYDSWPKDILNPSLYVGQKASFRELAKMLPSPSLIGLVGIGRTGKTTLIEHATQTKLTKERTEEISAYIVLIPGNPPKYIALLDGPGQYYDSQFKVIQPSDSLCISNCSDPTLIKQKITRQT